MAGYNRGNPGVLKVLKEKKNTISIQTSKDNIFISTTKG